MASGLNVNNNNFINISYKRIVDEIIKEQQFGEEKIKSYAYHVLNIPKVVDKVAERLSNDTIENVLGIPNIEDASVIFSTLKFEDELSENEKLKELKNALDDIVNEMDIYPANSILYSENRSYKREDNLGINIGYYDSKARINELSFGDSASNSLVRQDRVEIHMDITNMEDDIEKFLINYYTRRFKHLNEEELECIIERVKNREELVYKVRDYIITYRNGYLKRTIEGPIYLSFINDIMKESGGDKKFPEAYELFERYVKRINKFEKFIQDSIVNDGDDMYNIEYLNSTLDFIHSIRTSSVYSFLPFTGIIQDSPLSDTKLKDRSKGSEIYGLCLKRNGEVKATGHNTSFECHLDSLISIPKKFKEIKSNPKEYESKKMNLEQECGLNKYGKDFIKALIFKYVLVNLEDEEYDAIGVLKSDLLKYKAQKLNTTEKVILAIRELIIDLYSSRKKIEGQLAKIKIMLDTTLKNSNKSYKKEYTKKFSVLNAILPKDEDLSDGILLDYLKIDKDNQVNQYNKLFKYTTLLDDDLNSDYYAYSFDYKIVLKSDTFEKPDKPKDITIKFNNKDFNPFSVVFYPTVNTITNRNQNDVTKIMKDFVKNELKIEENQTGNYPAIFIDYDNDNNKYYKDENDKYKNKKETYRFVYETAYTLIVGVLMSLISDKLSEKLFESKAKENPELLNNIEKHKKDICNSLYLMFMQLTFNEENGNKVEFSKSQDFVYRLRKSLASSLSSKNTGSSQGFNVVKNRYKTQNAINSLLWKMNKTVVLYRDINKLNKTAIIIASSRHHDRSKYDKKIENVNVHYEIITVDRLKEKNKIDISSYGEFTQFVEKEGMYNKSSTVFADKIKELRAEGYKDIIYLAKAPFTANMIEKRDKTEMYFMNEEVIKSMVKDFDDVTVYPLYMNTARIHLGAFGNTSGTNIASVKNICEDLDENLEGTVPLFQIFGDNAVDKSDRSFYNESIIYSTIKGVYSEELKPHIGQDNILDNNGENPYVEDLKLIMTSIHIVRNQKYLYGDKNLKTIKNNPFKMVVDTSEGTNGISISNYSVRRSRGKERLYRINRFALTSYIQKTLSK